ncbi:MAG: hypothetical protein ACRBBP_01890 [Bdellovibrionales bacterium]
MESAGLELNGKITNSVCMQLETQGVLVGDYLEQAGLSAHKALDSEMWIPAEKVELFLDLISKDYPEFYPKEIALNAIDIRGWGLLDQVLRILQSPAEIYEHPQRFLSYFIRPSLDFEWVNRATEASSFKVSLSTDEMPLVADYLAGALEVVSKYVGADSSVVTWSGNLVSIDWSKKQDSFFEEKKEPVNFKPEIYKEAVEIIQRQQSEILDFKLKAENFSAPDFDSQKIVEDLKVLSDYFLRSRQLVSLLKAESGKKKWFKEALKRLNWDELQGLHSQKVEDIKSRLIDQQVVSKTITPSEDGEQIGLSLEH